MRNISNFTPSDLASALKGWERMRQAPQLLLVGALVAVLLAVAGKAPAWAQETAPADTATFTGGVEAVTISASVRDRRGRIVRDLTKAQFEVVDTGRIIDIKDVYAGESPLSLAVLLDISGSMAVGGNIERARAAVALTTRSLEAARDEAALYTFDSKLQEVVPFTTEVDRLRRVSLAGRPFGTTSLYDAVAETARHVAARTNRHRAVLVITDGMDTGSQLSARHVSGIASSIDVPVYLLVVVNPVDHPGGPLSLVPADDGSSDTANLADLSRWTGGDMRIASSPDHSSAAVRDLFTQLRHQYLITFEPGARAGWHPLEVRVKRRNLVVHARSGYIAGSARSGS